MPFSRAPAVRSVSPVPTATYRNGEGAPVSPAQGDYCQETGLCPENKTEGEEQAPACLGLKRRRDRRTHIRGPGWSLRDMGRADCGLGRGYWETQSVRRLCREEWGRQRRHRGAVVRIDVRLRFHESPPSVSFKGRGTPRIVPSICTTLL